MGDRYTYEAIEIVDDSSGRIHRLVRELDTQRGKARILSDERCQKDQLGDWTALDPEQAAALHESADEDRFCGFCHVRD